MSDIDEKREAHEASLPNARWFSVPQLAARWGISETTVRLIPITELRYKEFGAGKKVKRRRYRPEWVEAYENETGQTPTEHAA